MQDLGKDTVVSTQGDRTIWGTRSLAIQRGGCTSAPQALRTLHPGLVSFGATTAKSRPYFSQEI